MNDSAAERPGTSLAARDPARCVPCLGQGRGLLLDSLVECLPNGVIAVDLQGRILVNNPAAIAIAGVGRDNIPLDMAAWIDSFGVCQVDGSPITVEELPITRALRGEVVQSFKLRFHHERRSDDVYIEASAKPLYDAQGQLSGAVAVFTDISAQRHAQLALTQSQHRYNQLVSNLPGIVFRASIDRGWRLEYIDGAVEEITGYPASYFTDEGHGWAEIMHPEDVDTVFRTLQRQRARGQSVRTQYRIRSRRGRVVWCESHASVVDGRWYDGLVLDITERKRAEIIAAENQSRLRAVFQQSPLFQGVLTLDGTLMGASENAFLQCGWTREQAIGRRFDEGPWWRHAQDTRDFVRGSIKTALKGEVVRQVCDYFVHGEAGPVRRRADFLAAPMRDAEGRTMNIYVAGLDVTESELAQQSLRDSEARFRLLTDATPQIVWTAAADGAIEFINRPGQAYFGLPAARLQGDGWTQSVHPDDLEATQKVWHRCLATGEPVEVQYRIRRNDGQYRWTMTRAVAQFDRQGRPQRWFGVTTDIEDLRNAQTAAQAATAAKSQFLASMSHEIRTPMNGVIGMTSLLQSTELDDVQREYVNTLRSSSEHLLSLINDILDLSKAESGKLELESRVIDLRSCVEDAIELVSGSAHEKGIELIFDAAPELPERVHVDASRLRQILVNLLSNGIKFTPEGEVLVRAMPVPGAVGERRCRIRFSVQDTGIGLAPERMGQLFGAFNQLDPSHGRIFGGTGLGLAISKRLVERMGGRIWAENTPGVGAAFLFEIDAGEVAAGAPITVTRFSGQRILLVDDNANTRRAITRLLRKQSLQVQEAASAAEALEIVAREPQDLLLLDSRLPGERCSELSRALRAASVQQPLPVILLAAAPADLSVEHGELFTAYLLKPLRRAALLAQLADQFERPGRPVRRPVLEADPHLARQHPLRVLVAEDNTANQKVLMRFLARLGYTADLVDSGLDAVQALSRRPYDVVLMDVQMPQMDGLEATRQIRLEHPLDPYIIAVTANAQPSDERLCRTAGMNDYLSKPIVPRELSAALLRAAATLEQTRTDARPARLLAAAASPRSGSESSNDYQPAMTTRLRQLLDVEGAQELIQALRLDMHSQLDAIALALQERDADRSALVAHTLKSTCLILGAANLSQLCARIESDLRQGQFDQADASAVEMARRYEELIDSLSLALMPPIPAAVEASGEGSSMH